MASLGGIGLYSRHLTEEDVSNIGAATRAIITGAQATLQQVQATAGFSGRIMMQVPEAVLSQAAQRGEEEVVVGGKVRCHPRHHLAPQTVSLLTGLLFSGHYEHVISTILRYLNATQLACLQKVGLVWSPPRPAAPGTST